MWYYGVKLPQLWLHNIFILLKNKSIWEIYEPRIQDPRFHNTNRCKAALQNILRFYIIFRSRLLVVTMAEMYSKNHAVSYKLHVIKQTMNTINCNDYMLRLNFAIAI